MSSPTYMVVQLAKRVRRLENWMNSHATLPHGVPTASISQVTTPIISPAGGNFITSQLVTITCATVGALIKYTLDGVTDPTPTTGTQYLAPFSVTDDTEVRAVAYAVGMATSDIAQEVFVKTTPVSTVIYWGVSESSMLDEAGILALTGNMIDTDPAGSYTHTITSAPPYKYLYWAWPDNLTKQPVASTGFTSAGFPMDMATASEGFIESENGWYYKIVVVSGVNYRLYRSYWPQGVSFIVTITTS